MTVQAPRRTQAERRATTRAKLLEAAMTSLIERGYGGTTLADVVARAGLTNGALWRHFRSKGALMAEVALACEEQLAEFPVASAGSPAQRVSDAVAHLWSQAQAPAFQALLE